MNPWEKPCHGPSGRHIWRHITLNGTDYESCWRCGAPRTEADRLAKEGATP